MKRDQAEREALFRHSVLGDLLSRPLKRGELKKGLEERSAKTWKGPDGRPRRVAEKTLEDWFYRYKKQGFDGLKPRARRDRGEIKTLTPQVQELILAMKREDPGRSAPLILRELIQAGRLPRYFKNVSAIQRLLKREGLSGPQMELERPARLRWQASRAGELWQGDALHGPSLFDPSSGRPLRVKIFALLDDRSRLITYLRAGFHETQEAFLAVVLGAVLRRGIPTAILLDNHGSFTGSDVRIACAKLQTRLTFARPHDGPAKGKVERFWRTLRAHVLSRIDTKKLETLDDLNLRLWAWVEGEYNRRPHSALRGKTPLEVWEEDADEIRWVEDPHDLERIFTDSFERLVKNDATCQIRGKTFEVPPHLRGQRVSISYSLLNPSSFWIQDGNTCVPLREVDPEGNARKRRNTPPPPPPTPPGTGLNSVEDLLRRLTRPHERKDHPDA